MTLKARAHFACGMLSFWGFPGGSDGKASACNAGDPGLTPGSGRSLGEGNGTLLQYSRLENPMDGGARQATVRGVPKSRTRLSDFTFFLSFRCILDTSSTSVRIIQFLSIFEPIFA